MSNAAAVVATTETDLKPLANAIRALAMDAVQAANSGHPGMPMGMADVATVLFSKFLKRFMILKSQLQAIPKNTLKPKTSIKISII